MTDEKPRKNKAEHKEGEGRFMRGKKEQISLTVPAGTTDRLDAVAGSLGLSRAAALNLSISDFLKKYK